MKLISLIALIFAFTHTPAHAADSDGVATSTEGALVEKKISKSAKKKKAKGEKKAAAEKVASDAGAKEEPVKVTDALKPVERKKEKDAAKKEDEKASKTQKRADGLVIEDVKVGSGMEAQLGKTITVHYKGTLMNGKVFDSSYDRNEPIAFQLEEGRLIKGWTEGIPGMKVGGKRKLTIPYAMAYGERGTPDGSIPPRSDLKFEVELIKVE